MARMGSSSGNQLINRGDWGANSFHILIVIQTHNPLRRPRRTNEPAAARRQPHFRGGDQHCLNVAIKLLFRWMEENPSIDIGGHFTDDFLDAFTVFPPAASFILPVFNGNDADGHFPAKCLFTE